MGWWLENVTGQVHVLALWHLKIGVTWGGYPIDEANFAPQFYRIIQVGRFIYVTVQSACLHVLLFMLTSFLICLVFIAHQDIENLVGIMVFRLDVSVYNWCRICCKTSDNLDLNEHWSIKANILICIFTYGKYLNMFYWACLYCLCFAINTIHHCETLTVMICLKYDPSGSLRVVGSYLFVISVYLIVHVVFLGFSF